MLVTTNVIIGSGGISDFSSVYAEHTESTHEWKEVYAKLLREYAELPLGYLAGRTFILHDINHDGTPELFIVNVQAGIFPESIYTFLEGQLIQIEGDFFAYFDITVPFDRPGLITQAYGKTTLLELHGNTLVAVEKMERPFFPDDEQRWIINGNDVTEREYIYLYSSIMPSWEERNVNDLYLPFPHNITEETIQSVIFNWQP